MIRAWDEALGPEFKSHCRPDGVRNGVIHARVSDSSWMQRVQLEKPRIFARLRAQLGEGAPTELRLRIGPSVSRAPSGLTARAAARRCD